MERDVVGRHAPITQVRSAEEGLLVSLNQHGGVDLDYIATALRQAGRAGHRRNWAI